MPRLKLSPAGLQYTVAAGTRLQDLLFAQGVEFPCGGRGRCRGCRVRLIQGELPVSEEERKAFAPADLAAGWRSACRHTATTDLELEVAQWETSILTDQTSFAFVPRTGLGVAIDLGSTTLAAQLLDLSTGHVLAVRTALNAQARHGGDIMSRIEFAMQADGQAVLQRLIREQLGGLVAQLLEATAHSRTAGTEVTRVAIVGNTVMHHLFCGVSVAPLSIYPFEPVQSGRIVFAPTDLGWALPATARIEFLPCLGGFVGSDILAGIVATGLHLGEEPVALMDLGTNGEVVVGNREKLFCSSTAAGPAFEGARIAQGMRAATGAIGEVHIENQALVCRVLGGGEARGLCGSGLVDAVACALELRWIQPSGRMEERRELPLTPTVQLLASDVRELQLAKGAIAAGLRILARSFGVPLGGLKQVHLAGAFGNYINRTSAQRIGLLRVPISRVLPAGNTALLGAKMALFGDAEQWDALARRVQHVSLHEADGFQDIYVEEMRFSA